MARRKASDKKATEKKNRAASNIQADQYSIAFEELHVAGNIGGDIRIGHTIGYTAKQVSVLLNQITTTLEPKKFDGRCPYKGLEVFEEEDAELFFGRERLVNELVGRVKESPTVFITGPSGSGKSSLVRAGLIHALKQGAVKGSDRWLYETLKPGREPLKDLALAFSRLKSPELEDYFLAHSNESDILNRSAESVLSGRKEQRFVLFIDQFEEVFTQINSEEERITFINMLAHAGTIENGRVIVLFAMRSDFVSNCATYPALNELLSQEFRQIGAMQPDELVSAIALPARHVGLPVEHELIAQIINDMKGEPDALPLMQFALKDLFDAKQAEGGVIALTLKDYLQHGGIHKSLERHADATFAKLSESEQELTRSIFSGLIEIGRGTQDTKRTALFDELIPANTKPEEVRVIVQKLADARLVITDEQAGKDTVAISHEKLIDAWPWLKKLVNENRDAIALQNEIASDAKEWENHKHDVSYLYSGARLANVSEQLDAKKLLLSETSHEFVKAGRIRQQRSQGTLIAGVSAIVILLLVAVIVFSNLSITNANTASTAQAAGTEAVAQKATAQAASTLAVAEADEAQKQSNIALARQLAAQAQSFLATGNSRQMLAVLLAIQSMKMLPSVEPAQVLQHNVLALPITQITYNDGVADAAFSPDGKHMVIGGCNKSIDYACVEATVQIWNVSARSEIANINNGPDVSSVTFSPDSKYVASGGCEIYNATDISCSQGSIRVWEVITGNEIIHIISDYRIHIVSFSPDGKYILSAGGEGSVTVWDVNTGKEISRMVHDHVSSVAFSPDGKYIVSGGCETYNTFDYYCSQGSIRVWEMSTGKEISRMFQKDVFSVAFSPDGTHVVSGGCDNSNRTVDSCSQGSARVWEATTGIEISHMIHDDDVSPVVFSPDGKYVVSGSFDNTARVWEAATGTEISRLTYDSSVISAAFSPDGNYVVSGSGDATARVWDVSTGNEIARLTHDGSVYSVAFSPDGQYVVSIGEDRTARLWDISSRLNPEVSNGAEVARTRYDGAISELAFGPDAKYMVSTSPDNSITVKEVVSGNEIARIAVDDDVYAIALSEDNKYIAAVVCDAAHPAECTESSVNVWEIATENKIASMTQRGDVSSVAFSPDGKYVVSGDDIGIVRTWEIATGNEIRRMTHDKFLSAFAFSPDGAYIVSASSYNNIRVWEVDTGNEVARMSYDDWAYSIAFSPDGKYVVSGDSTGIVRVWEVDTGNEVARMLHNDLVPSVAFSPDGKYVVSGSRDKTVRVWETQSGREINRMTHDGGVLAISFSPDGKYLMSGSIDRTVRTWIWSPEDLISLACSRITRNLTREEWAKHIGDVLEYEAICPNLPIEPEPTPTVAP